MTGGSAPVVALGRCDEFALVGDVIEGRSRGKDGPAPGALLRQLCRALRPGGGVRQGEDDGGRGGLVHFCKDVFSEDAAAAAEADQDVGLDLLDDLQQAQALHRGVILREGRQVVKVFLQKIRHIITIKQILWQSATNVVEQLSLKKSK